MMSRGEVERPQPVADVFTEEFWNGVRAGKLVIQRCCECGFYNHPPLSQCYSCYSERLQFQEVSGQGTVYSYTVTRRKFVEGFHEPYCILVIELAEQDGLFLLSEWQDEAHPPRIGTEVKFRPKDVGNDVVLAEFMPA